LDSGKVDSSATVTDQLFTSSVSGCPIEAYEIRSYTGSAVTIVNPTDLATAYLNIVRTAGFTATMDLRATIGSTTSDISLKIVVCGDETIALADTKTVIIVNELLTGTATTPYQVSDSTIKAYFTVDVASSSSFCGQLTLGLYKDDQGATQVTSPDVSLHGTAPAQSLEIASAQAVNSKIYIKAETRG